MSTKAGTRERPHGRRALDTQPDLVAVRTGIANRIRAVQFVLGLNGTEMVLLDRCARANLEQGPLGRGARSTGTRS